VTLYLNTTTNSSSLPAATFLGQTVVVVIDRPLGSFHPTHGFIYPVNYGFLPGVPAPDGEGQDAYVLGVDEPLERFRGVCVAVIHRLDDEDDKLVVLPEGEHMDNDEIRRQTHFQEQLFQSEIVRKTCSAGTCRPS
jgi:inorganic pyrophosphatase